MAVVISKTGDISSREFEFKGLSTDIKPIDTYNGEAIPTGSVFLEMDTREVFFYTRETQEWLGE